IGPDGTIYVTGNGGYLGAFNPDGTQKWTFNTGAYGTVVLSGDGTTVYATGGATLYAINATSGLKKWQYKARANLSGSPTASPDGTIYLADASWYLNAVTPTGGSKWRVSLGKVKGTTPPSSNTPSVSADGQTVYVGGVDGLYAISSTGAVKWKFG